MLHIKNKKFLEVLNSWQTTDWDIDVKSKHRHGRGGRLVGQPDWNIADYDKISAYATSDEYIKEIIEGAEPLYYTVVNPFGELPFGKYILDNMPFEYDFYATAMYKPRGFVGWHNDVDIPGWFFMMSYSPEGLGFFKYRDAKSGEIIKKDDVEGWNYVNFSVGTAPETHYWHCALAPSLRFTWLFGFNSEEKYNQALDILNEDIN
jgi:hypothetical protein